MTAAWAVMRLVDVAAGCGIDVDAMAGGVAVLPSSCSGFAAVLAELTSISAKPYLHADGLY